eukprot:COSAG02_NODE_29368_length_570_cov_1.528662_1_plen_86_part_00
MPQLRSEVRNLGTRKLDREVGERTSRYPQITNHEEARRGWIRWEYKKFTNKCSALLDRDHLESLLFVAHSHRNPGDVFTPLACTG